MVCCRLFGIQLNIQLWMGLCKVDTQVGRIATICYQCIAEFAYRTLERKVPLMHSIAVPVLYTHVLAGQGKWMDGWVESVP